MALVVLLRGVNVGGHRNFRPTALACDLAHLDVVNIGAAGTFVVRRPVAQTKLRAELADRLPFDTEVVICSGKDIVRLLSKDYYGDSSVKPDIVRFVSVLSRRPTLKPAIPTSLPPDGEWLLKIVAVDARFVVGLYRRSMKAIGHLGALDRLFGVPATTRNRNTMTAVARVLGDDGA
jgi:uncharacterized protein (DUF1697 family)